MVLAGCLVSLVGCQNDPAPRPARAVQVAPLEPLTDKPLPPPVAPGREVYAPPFQDAPLVKQALPEESAFLPVYQEVGSPRIAVFVNRTLEGQTIPTNPGGAVSGTERVRQTTGAVTVETRNESRDPYRGTLNEKTDRMESTGPVEVRDRTEKYLAPGQYDEIQAKRIDYDAVEAILADFISAGGKVAMVSPRLTESQMRGLEKGDRNVLQQLSKDNQVDVLIQVQAHPTKQTFKGLELRLVAEAINTGDGASIGRAVVDTQPPLDKPQINEYTRYLARKLMDDMAGTWTAPRPAPATQPNR